MNKTELKIITKNLLLNHTCNKCKYSFFGSCVYNSKKVDGILIPNGSPKNNTCMHWEGL